MKKLAVVMSILVFGLFLTAPAFASELPSGENLEFGTVIQEEAPMVGEAFESKAQISEEMNEGATEESEAALAVWNKTSQQFPDAIEESSQQSAIDKVQIDLTVDEQDKNAIEETK